MSDELTLPATPEEEIATPENPEEIGDEVSSEISESPSSESQSESTSEELPEGVKARLGRQEKRHQRQLRDMQYAYEQKLREMGASPKVAAAPAEEDPMGLVKNLIQEVIHESAQEQQQRANNAHMLREQRKLELALEDAELENPKDFDVMLQNFRGIQVAAIERAAMVTPHENGAAVLMHLGNNPTELNRISRLSPIEQEREVIKLSGQLAMSKKKLTKTPAPLSKNKSSNSTDVLNPSSYSQVKQQVMARYQRMYAKK